RRDVVGDDRQRRAHAAGDVLEVAEQAVLRRPVVVRRDVEEGVGPGLARALAELDRLRRGVGAGAGDDGDPAARLFQDHPYDVHLLFEGQGRGFAGGPRGDQAVDAAGDLLLDEVGEGAVVHATVAERGDERGHGAVEAGVHVSFIHYRAGV